MFETNASIVKREVPRKPKAKNVVVLEMTKREAETLLTLARQVGGSMAGRRGDIARIDGALRAAGLSPANGGDELYREAIRSQAIYFKD